MIEVGDSSILHVSPPWFMPHYEPSKRRLTWPNGCIGIVYSGDEPGQLRGPQHDTAWCDELAKFRYTEETWSNLTLGLRVGPKPQICITTTPRPIPLIKRLMKSPTTRDIQRPTDDNVENLSPTYIREVIDPMRGTRLGRQEIEAQILEDTPGALWKLAAIDSLRVSKAPDLSRIIVAVDPEITSGEQSAETGIIVAGIAANGHGYVLEDASLRDTPHGWGSRAVLKYHAHKADRVVAETNQGGEMVKMTIATVDPTVAYKGVHASRSKQARAEPVAALYEQGKVHHVGAFPELEDQLTSWVPGGKSPDRLDALVWAFTELMLAPQISSEPNTIYDD
jgi:phage terminase large subunit-like protein